MILFEKAKPSDAIALANASQKAFDHDINYGAPSVGGPPGYKSDKWQARMMQVGDYYKILLNGVIVGGMIVFKHEAGHYELGRIFIEPSAQNKGIGGQAMTFLEQTYPFASRFTLDTPRWAVRNHHFYRKMGYVQIGFAGTEGILYEKRLLEQQAA